jgi:hypothetical protein
VATTIKHATKAASFRTTEPRDLLPPGSRGAAAFDGDRSSGSIADGIGLLYLSSSRDHATDPDTLPAAIQASRAQNRVGFFILVTSSNGYN